MNTDPIFTSGLERSDIIRRFLVWVT